MKIERCSYTTKYQSWATKLKTVSEKDLFFPVWVVGANNPRYPPAQSDLAQLGGKGGVVGGVV